MKPSEAFGVTTNALQGPSLQGQSLAAGIWRHYKGGYYQVLGIGAHSETDERMVVYVSLNGIDRPGPRLRIRPLSMWLEQVPLVIASSGPSLTDVQHFTVQRFVYIGPEMPPQ